MVVETSRVRPRHARFAVTIWVFLIAGAVGWAILAAIDQVPLADEGTTSSSTLDARGSPSRDALVAAPTPREPFLVVRMSTREAAHARTVLRLGGRVPAQFAWVTVVVFGSEGSLARSGTRVDWDGTFTRLLPIEADPTEVLRVELSGLNDVQLTAVPLTSVTFSPGDVRCGPVWGIVRPCPPWVPLP